MAGNERFLFGPYLDPLLLGGASIPVMLTLSFMTIPAHVTMLMAVVMLLLANFINHPHFAHSYQIFYGSWSDVRMGKMDAMLMKKWVLVGVFVPLILAIVLIVAGLQWAEGDGSLLAIAITTMGALVGWHYVKQGFGMAMVDAALKRKYWKPEARRALLINSYICWGVAWCLHNGTGAGQQLWGVMGVMFKIPSEIVACSVILGVVSTCWCGLQIFRALTLHRQTASSWQDLPLAGLLAYFISIYLWLILSSLVSGFIYFIPFFHSLQYLTVVYKFKRNEIKSEGGRSSLLRFAVRGLIFGALGFWLVPAGLDYFRSGELPKLAGYTSVFLAAFWLFINVHHYFIDNVLWRQGNPKVSQHLFGAKKT